MLMLLICRGIYVSSSYSTSLISKTTPDLIPRDFDHLVIILHRYGNSPFLWFCIQISPPSPNSVHLNMKKAINVFSRTKLVSAKTVLSTIASIMASAMVFRSVLNDLLPQEARGIFFSGIRRLLNFFSPQMTMVINEFDGLYCNQIFDAAETYLGSKVYSSQRLRVSKEPKEREFSVKAERNQEVVDVFRGIRFKWSLQCTRSDSRTMYNPRDLNSTLGIEVRSFELSFHKKHKEMVLNSYFPHIFKESVSLRQQKKTLKLFTVDFDKILGKRSDMWSSISLDHPATFDTIAMDAELKNTILEDLERFIRRKDYYRKVGKAWKRGYLLYGPPGTGKSSLIAAMANYLNFDIYDLELTENVSNSDLRTLLLSIANQSILVVEDIDCTIKMDDRLVQFEGLFPRSSLQKKQVRVLVSTFLLLVAEKT